MRVEIVCIGSQLTREGRIFESVPALVEMLRKMSVDVARISTLPDEPLLLRSGLEKLLHDAQLVIAVGGWHTHEIAAKIFESAKGEKKLLVLPEDEVALIHMLKGELGESVKALFPKQKPRLREVIYFVLTDEQEVRPLMKTWGREFPGIRMDLSMRGGVLTLLCEGDAKETLEQLSCAIRAIFYERIFASEHGLIEEAVHRLFIQERKRLAVAESCTGGRLAARLIALPGASNYFLGGVVAYDNEMKRRLLAVPDEVLDEEGAVSATCVASMVEGLFSNTDCDIALAVSGIAGPDGGTREKPVGTVWGAIGERDKSLQTFCLKIHGTRSTIIERSSTEMLARLWQFFIQE